MRSHILVSVHILRILNLITIHVIFRKVPPYHHILRLPHINPGISSIPGNRILQQQIPALHRINPKRPIPRIRPPSPLRPPPPNSNVSPPLHGQSVSRRILNRKILRSKIISLHQNSLRPLLLPSKRKNSLVHPLPPQSNFVHRQRKRPVKMKLPRRQLNHVPSLSPNKLLLQMPLNRLRRLPTPNKEQDPRQAAYEHEPANIPHEQSPKFSRRRRVTQSFVAQALLPVHAVNNNAPTPHLRESFRQTQPRVAVLPNPRRQTFTKRVTIQS